VFAKNWNKSPTEKEKEKREKKRRAEKGKTCATAEKKGN